jgi:hypothetical protein
MAEPGGVIVLLREAAPGTPYLFLRDQSLPIPPILR